MPVFQIQRTRTTIVLLTPEVLHQASSLEHLFEHTFMTVELNTSLAVATQVLRHRSATYQQFSQRFADIKELQLEIPIPDLRRQDTKNRQNSIDDINPRDKAYMEAMIAEHFQAKS